MSGAEEMITAKNNIQIELFNRNRRHPNIATYTVLLRHNDVIIPRPSYAWSLYVILYGPKIKMVFRLEFIFGPNLTEKWWTKNLILQLIKQFQQLYKKLFLEIHFLK